jgi:hypothetical protein
VPEIRRSRAQPATSGVSSAWGERPRKGARLDNGQRLRRWHVVLRAARHAGWSMVER